MELQNEITIENTPALVSVNFDQLRERLETELQRYEVVVTADTVSDAKKLATELNSTKKVIDDRRKAEVAKASEPIKQFDEQMKDLVMMCAKGRQDILDQVKRFEDKTRELCRTLLTEARRKLWLQYGVDEEFRRAEVEDLVKISNVTAKENLTKAAKDQVEARVRNDESLQNQTARRLLELENQSYKAGLAAPLRRDHIEPFLFADNDVYKLKLEDLLKAEIDRQEESERRLRAQIEKENERKEQERKAAAAKDTASNQQQEINTQPPAADPAPQSHSEQAAQARDEQPARPTPNAKGDITYVVTCSFEVTVPAALTEAQIDGELRRVMGKAGLAQTLTAVYVIPKEHAA